jgi:hypothetical protein
MAETLLEHQIYDFLPTNKNVIDHFRHAKHKTYLKTVYECLKSGRTRTKGVEYSTNSIAKEQKTI